LIALPMGEDAAWMGVALEEADLAASLGEVPVGCLVVAADGSEIGRGRNARESLQDPTAHAEILALRAAAAKIGGWRLEGATVYATLEPCAMCAGALVLARVARVVYGCDDPKAGAVTTMFGVGVDPRLNHRFEVVSGVRADECAARLRVFFGRLRTGAT
jgi:tRNA(adenine34) deaminase